MTEQRLRAYIRQVLNEEVNNYQEKQPETATKQLDDNSTDKDLGDPLTDVKMNQKADDLGSDGKNAPAVSVTAGSAKGGKTPTAGQHQTKFSDKTKQA
jgi:hypothetical protein